MKTGKQTASMEAWEALGTINQVEIVTKAAKRATYQAGAYSVVVAVDELIGETWPGIVDRLNAEKLDKANKSRTAAGKQPLTITQIAFRAAHCAAELQRYNYNKHDNVASLESWTAIDDGNMEDRIIDHLTMEDFAASRDAVDKLIIEMLPQDLYFYLFEVAE